MEAGEARSKYQRASRLCAEKRFGEALTLLNALQEAFPGSRDIIYAKAKVLAQAGSTAEALRLCESMRGDPRVDELAVSLRAQLVQPATGTRKRVRRLFSVALILCACVASGTLLLVYWHRHEAERSSITAPQSASREPDRKDVQAPSEGLRTVSHKTEKNGDQPPSEVIRIPWQGMISASDDRGDSLSLTSVERVEHVLEYNGENGTTLTLRGMYQASGKNVGIWVDPQRASGSVDNCGTSGISKHPGGSGQYELPISFWGNESVDLLVVHMAEPEAFTPPIVSLKVNVNLVLGEGASELVEITPTRDVADVGSVDEKQNDGGCAPFPNPFSCSEVRMTSSGRWLFIGSGEGVVSDDGGKTWKKFTLPGGIVTELPRKPSTMLSVRFNEVFLTQDDGANWQSLPTDSSSQIKQAFWSVSDGRKYLIIDIDGNCFQGGVGTSGLGKISSVNGFALEHSQVEGKHFLKVGVPDKYVCKLSSDDAKSWTDLPVSESPWAAEAELAKSIPSLTPKAGEAARCYVRWAKALCHENALFGSIGTLKESAKSENTGVFLRKDGRDPWQAITGETTAEEPASLFAKSPLGWMEKRGASSFFFLDVSHVFWDKRRNAIVARKGNGKCYVTFDEGKRWTLLSE